MGRRRDVLLATRAKRHGARYALRIVWEARAAGLPISLGFALIEQESGFRNVFGHDPVRNIRGGKVTRSRYLEYKRRRKLGQGMQGVGPAQLTWWEYQDQADALGGCWVPRHNIRVAFRHLAGLVKAKGDDAGIKAYNGTGPAADRYSSSVRARQQRWHERLS